MPARAAGSLEWASSLGVPPASAVLTAALAAAALVLGEATGDTSWVDRLWSLVPTWHAWLMFLLSDHQRGSPDAARALAVCVLTTAWSARLTYNFWRKGGYSLPLSKGEDYRYALTHALAHSRTRLLTHSLTHSLTHARTHARTHAGGR